MFQTKWDSNKVQFDVGENKSACWIFPRFFLKFKWSLLAAIAVSVAHSYAPNLGHFAASAAHYAAGFFFFFFGAASKAARLKGDYVCSQNKVLVDIRPPRALLLLPLPPPSSSFSWVPPKAQLRVAVRGFAKLFWVPNGCFFFLCSLLDGKGGLRE